DASRGEERLVDLEVGQILLDVAALLLGQRLDRDLVAFEVGRGVDRVVPERVQRLVMHPSTVSPAAPKMRVRQRSENRRGRCQGRARWPDKIAQSVGATVPADESGFGTRSRTTGPRRQPTTGATMDLGQPL